MQPQTVEMLAQCLLVGLVLGALLATYLSQCFVIVKENEVVFTEWLGRSYRMLKAGPHVVFYPLETLKQADWSISVEDSRTGEVKPIKFKSTCIPLDNRIYDFPPIDVYTRDHVQARSNGAIVYQIVDPKKALYNINDPWKAMEQTLVSSFRQTIRGLTFDELSAGHSAIIEQLRKDFDQNLHEYGLALRHVDLQSFSASKELMGACEKAVQAKKEAEAHTAAQQSRQQAFESEAKLRQLKLDTELKERRSVAEAKALALQLELEAVKKVEEGAVEEYIRSRALVKLAANKQAQLLVPYLSRDPGASFLK